MRSAETNLFLVGSVENGTSFITVKNPNKMQNLYFTMV